MGKYYVKSCNILMRPIALSTWILTFEKTLEILTSRCDNWGLPLVKVGMARLTPLSAKSSEISNLDQQVLSHHK